MSFSGWQLAVSSARWLICRNEDASKKIFVVTGILVFDFELFIGGRFSQNRWEKIRQKVGLANLRFHDLRKTFGSILAQNSISTAVTQKLLEHSSPDLTNKVYTNVDPVLRHAVDQIPVDDWL